MEQEKFLQYKKILTSYILQSGKNMLHFPSAKLPHPFIVPGAGYAHDLWDWDCFFSVMALLQILEHRESLGELDEKEKDLYITHAKGNVLNFLHAQMEDGFTPIVIQAVDSYLDCKILYSNGCLTNMHKPCLIMNAVMISGYTGDYGWISPYFDKLEKFLECYEKNYMHQCGLFVWANDIMIGVDNDPSTFGRPPKSSANIFLNALMLRELSSMAKLCRKLGKEEKQNCYTHKYENLKAIIQKECWDSRDGIYYSVDVDCRTRRPNPDVWSYHMGLGVIWETLPMKIQCWSSFIPLWNKTADSEQARIIVERHIRNNETFNSPCGIRSLSKDEKMYNLAPTSNPSNWMGPIWIVAQYMVFKGLLNYGFMEDARELVEKIVVLLGKDLEVNGALHEYYDPETGKGIIHKGFLNWNLLALNMISEIDGKPSIERFLP